MREIKFRAWNKDKNDWESVPYIITEGLNPTKIIGFLDENEGQCLLDDGHAIVQYTGIKDKNGREINESDIIIGISNQNLEVVSHLGSFGVFVKMRVSFLTEERKPIYTALHCYGSEELEVIGNIFVNPELVDAQ